MKPVRRMGELPVLTTDMRLLWEVLQASGGIWENIIVRMKSAGKS